MSKSKGNVIYADDLIDFLGVDAVRYFVRLHLTSAVRTFAILQLGLCPEGLTRGITFALIATRRRSDDSIPAFNPI